MIRFFLYGDIIEFDGVKFTPIDPNHGLSLILNQQQIEGFKPALYNLLEVINTLFSEDFESITEVNNVFYIIENTVEESDKNVIY